MTCRQNAVMAHPFVTAGASRTAPGIAEGVEVDGARGVCGEGALAECQQPLHRLAACNNPTH